MKNEAIQNAIGMFFNSFLAGLVATVIPAIISGINTSTGVVNLTVQVITAGLTVNALTALVLGINEYLRTQNGAGLGYAAGKVHKKIKGFLPFY